MLTVTHKKKNIKVIVQISDPLQVDLLVTAFWEVCKILELVRTVTCGLVLVHVVEEFLTNFHYHKKVTNGDVHLSFLQINKYINDLQQR